MAFRPVPPIRSDETQESDQMAPIWPRWPKIAQDGAKMAPGSPPMAQDGPKMAPRRPQDGPKTAPRWLLGACLGQSRAHWGHFGPRSSPEPKSVGFFRSKSTWDAWGSSVVRPRWTLIDKNQHFLAPNKRSAGEALAGGQGLGTAN